MIAVDRTANDRAFESVVESPPLKEIRNGKISLP